MWTRLLPVRGDRRDLDCGPTRQESGPCPSGTARLRVRPLPNGTHLNWTAQNAARGTIDGDEAGQRFVDLMEADLPSPDTPVLDAERSRLV
ncbi:MAG: hypothetical protein S0880_19115, partial [Actinomycetota bacterium]|nr:hypothetical protein [Actinomycetota bacterium]